MVVTRNGQDAAKRGGTCHIGMLEHISTPVYARAFSVPNTKYAIESLRASRRKSQLLRAP